jgi:hypothetical protein
MGVRAPVPGPIGQWDEQMVDGEMVRGRRGAGRTRGATGGGELERRVVFERQGLLGALEEHLGP